MIGRLERFPKPIVAAIHGACVGLGCELSLACSWRIATDAPKTKDCELSRLGFEMFAVAGPNLAAGADLAAEQVKIYQDYLAQLQPVSAKQVEVFCKATPGDSTVVKVPSS